MTLRAEAQYTQLQQDTACKDDMHIIHAHGLTSAPEIKQKKDVDEDAQTRDTVIGRSSKEAQSGKHYRAPPENCMEFESLRSGTFSLIADTERFSVTEILQSGSPLANLNTTSTGGAMERPPVSCLLCVHPGSHKLV